MGALLVTLLFLITALGKKINGFSRYTIRKSTLNKKNII